MNNREAITLLRNLEDSLDSYCGLNEEMKTAFRMAIEALNCSEIPNNSDTISRQAVTKFLNDWLSCLFENCHKQSASDLKMIIKDFKNLPSTQPETNCSEIPNNWIPCSERLPDDLEEVNVTWINHNFVKDKPFTASAVYYKGDWYWYSSVCADLLAEYGKNEIDKIDDAIEITAWMPLPEPYQKGGE